jgi:hypothetical protein
MSRNRISKDAFSQVVTMSLLAAGGRIPVIVATTGLQSSPPGA